MKTPFAAYHGDEPFVFVCYSHRDTKQVYPEIDWLHEQGERIWYDEGISAGRNWRGEIGNAIVRARTFIFYISANSLASDHCSREVNFALDEGVKILPIFLEEVELTPDLRLGLARLQALMRHDDPRYEEHLLAALDHDSAREPKRHMPSRSRRFQKKVWGAAALVIAMALLAFMLLPDILRPLTPDETPGVVAAPADPDVMKVGIKPFSNSPDQVDGLYFEVERRLAAIEGLLVRVSEHPGEQEDYRLSANFVAGNLRLELRDRNEVLVSNWTMEVGDDLEPVADGIARNLLLKLGRRDDGLRRFYSDISPGLFRTYLAAAATLRRSHSFASLDAAQAGFSHVLEEQPQYAPAHAGLCNTYLFRYEAQRDENDFLLAERHCHRALTLAQEDYTVHVALGSLYRLTGQFAKALDELNRAVDFAPWSTDAMRGLADALDAAGSTDEALQWYQEAIRVEPSHWENYQSLGLHYFSSAQFDKASEVFQSALALAPHEAAVRNNLAGTYFMMGDHAGAVEQWEQVAEANPSAKIYGNIAASYFYQGKFDEALRSYREASALAPQDYAYLGNIAEVLHIIDPPAAHAYFEEAIAAASAQLQINPNNALTLSDLAAYHAGLGMAEETHALLTRLKSAGDGDDPIFVLYNTAVAHLRLGEIETARGVVDELTSLGYEESLLALDENFRSLFPR